MISNYYLRFWREMIRKEKPDDQTGFAAFDHPVN
jgi:hypothetical protein